MRLAQTDPDAAVRRAIVDRLGRQDDPAIIDMLERRAVSDADAGVSLLSLERLRIHQCKRLGQLFEKIVYGHHPIYSHGAHGDTEGFDEILLPILKDRAHIYMVGHEHIAQHLRPEGGVHFITSSAAGQGARPAITGPRTLYSGSFHSPRVIDASTDELTVRFIDSDGKENYAATLKSRVLS